MGVTESVNYKTPALLYVGDIQYLTIEQKHYNKYVMG